MIFSAVVPLLDIRNAGTCTILLPGGLASFLLPEIIVTPSAAVQHTGTFLPVLPWVYLTGVILAGTFLIAGAAGLSNYSLQENTTAGSSFLTQMVRTASQPLPMYSSAAHR